MEITRGIINKPYKVLVYGPEGIGKTTFASRFPEPLFIDTEGSTSRIDVARLPIPSSWEYLLQEVDFVIKERPCKTLVIDTADWAEKLCIKHICSKHHQDGIEGFSYGKGYVYLAEEFGRLLNKLNEVNDAGINTVLTAHSIVRKFEQPDEMGAYDRYELKLEKKTAPLVKEWADMILFANYQTFVIEDSKTKSKKGTGGKRVMHTSHNPCWDAKNRSNLPDTLDFDFENIASLFENVQPALAVKQEPAEKEDHTPISVTDYMDEPGHIMEGDDIPKETEPDYTSDPEYEGLIPEVMQLMRENSITAAQLKKAVAKVGVVPEVTPFTSYPPEWQRAELLTNWSIKWMPLINDISLPF